MLHWTAWERGMKALYYLRSKSVQRAAFAGADIAEKVEVEAGARAPTTRSAWPASKR